MAGGYMGRIGFIDLSTGEIKEEKLEEMLARDFIGGYGLGVRMLFERQKKGIDPLGPENILGFYHRPFNRDQNALQRALHNGVQVTIDRGLGRCEFGWVFRWRNEIGGLGCHFYLRHCRCTGISSGNR